MLQLRHIPQGRAGSILCLEVYSRMAGDLLGSMPVKQVSYGLDGVGIRAEGMIGFSGALQRCAERMGESETLTALAQSLNPTFG